jgi:radical SAM protein with 4Fe4S-binding SPASM domain
MGLGLRPDLILEKVELEGHVLLRKREPALPPKPTFRLHPIQAMILALFDGRRSPEEVCEIVAAVFEQSDTAKRLVEVVLDRYRQFLLERGPGDPPADVPDPSEFVFPAGDGFRDIREPAPTALMWIVTECCNKRCRYCYKDAAFVSDGRATDLGLPFQRMTELIAEAADIGVTAMVLSGGEPFLRPDLIDLIGVMVEHRLDVVPITKDRITGDRMRALAATGLKHLHVSLDSHRAPVVDFLTKIPGAFDQIVDTIKSAVEHGLPVVLRPVLTSYNVRDFAALVELVYALGVREILADIYGESCGRHDQTFLIAAEDYCWLRQAHQDLTERFPDAEIKFKFDKGPPADAKIGRGCVEGARGMTFLPNGKVTKCEHWRVGDELSYGDLRTQSIMEAWQSDRIAALNWAAKDCYAGTVCHRCPKFDACNLKRGRCSLSAMLEYQSAFAPDVYCPIGAFGKRPAQEVSHAASA